MSSDSQVALPLRPLKWFFDRWHPQYKGRVVSHLVQLLPDEGEVLDVGCDDGNVAAAIQARKPGLRFEGVDIQDLRPCKIPRKVYDGLHLPYPDDSFDVVMAVDVLHHTNTIAEILTEMGRVSRKHVLLKEHMSRGRISHWMIGFGDWLSNVPYSIPCVYNYPTYEGWLAHFATAKLTVAQMIKRPQLGIYGTPKENPIFLLEKLPASASQ